MTETKLECLLLTWHGTLLCAADSGGLCQKPLTDRDCPSPACRLTVATTLDHGSAAQGPLPDHALPFESTTLGEGVATRVADGRGFHFPRDRRFLCAPESAAEEVGWNREVAGPWERFLPVPVELLIRLLDLRTRDWIDQSNGRRIAGRAIAFRRNFMFSIGPLDCDLTRTFPSFPSPSGTLPRDGSSLSVCLPGFGGQAAEFVSTREAAAPSEEPLWLRSAEHEQAAGAPESLDAPELKAPEVLYYPPTFAHRDDRKFFVTHSWIRRPRLGYSTSRVTVRQAHGCYLMLFRTLEGVVFDAGGVRRGYGFLVASKHLPRAVQKEGDRYFIDRQSMDEAPLLAGDYLVFYNGNLQNYYHWLVEGILSLYMLRRIRHADSAILLPAALGKISPLQYFESLKLLGLGEVQTLCAAPLVRLERARWIATPADPLEDFPEPALLEFQSLAAASVARSAGNLRLYVERELLRTVENAAEVREFLERAGFVTIRLEGMPFAEQVRLFAGAEFVVGPHGAGLANLLFTPPSARVIEFMPGAEMRPFFWLISSKLGHEYGMLRCDTDSGKFNGKLRVDVQKLARLLSLLEKA